jgi:capsular exopolysaccharide synthesis family protein
LGEVVRIPPDVGGGRLKNLHILCAGSRVPNPSLVLGGEAMAKLLRESRDEYDMVIFDAAPAMFVADAAPLASGCDGVVMILSAGTSRRNAADRATKQLEALDSTIIGAVLNKVRPKALRHYGSYGYYYYDYQRYYKDYTDDDGDAPGWDDQPHERSARGKGADQ